jgi:predicted metal-dependent hydrolase
VLSYSWRLILAPSPVLDYVTAHEVAHLIEMNHSARFWRLVKAHAPAAEEARRWLKANGARLHRYG